MASPHQVHVTLSDPTITDAETASLGSALERVLEAQQDLVIRRASLMLEELIAKASDFVTGSLIAVAGSLLAVAGWFIAMAGVVNALDEYFARFAVELALGALHILAGIALIFARRWRAGEAT